MDALDERRELIEVFTAREDAEGAREAVVRDSPDLTEVVRVEPVEVAELY